MNSIKKIPVTIITGYLGSGKTTFINYLLRQKHGFKFAIIENEFGDVGIDDGLVIQTEEEIIEMMNGCICCTVREDLIATIKRLIKRKKDKFDHIIIETTGLADPAPIAQTFFIDEEISNVCGLDSIITFIDAKHTVQHLDEQKPEGVENEAHEQVAFADVLVLNKTDLVSKDELETTKMKLNNINVHAPIIECQYSQIPIDKILNIHAFDLKKTLDMDNEFLDISNEHHHDESIKSFGIHVEGKFDADKLNKWLSELLKKRGPDIYRSKGIFSINGSDDKYVFQSVHMILNFGSASKLGFKQWKPNEHKINKFCFIGKNLDKEEMIKKIKNCLYNSELLNPCKIPEPGKIPGYKLKLNVEDIVLCLHDTNWELGIIIKIWAREELWETGKYAPYQVLLENGGLIYIENDHPDFIKKIDNNLI